MRALLNISMYFCTIHKFSGGLLFNPRFDAQHRLIITVTPRTEVYSTWQANNLISEKFHFESLAKLILSIVSFLFLQTFLLSGSVYAEAKMDREGLDCCTCNVLRVKMGEGQETGPSCSCSILYGVCSVDILWACQALWVIIYMLYAKC